MAILTSKQVHINLDNAIASLTTDKVLKVGWPKNTRYQEDRGGKYIAEVAAQNEYGAPHLHIPARPFLAPAISENKSLWLELIVRGSKKAVRGETNISEIFNVVGIRAARDVKKAIQAVTSPPLAPYTIAQRKARYTSKGNRKKINPMTLEKPLVDTGIMLAAVTHAVEAE